VDNVIASAGANSADYRSLRENDRQSDDSRREARRGHISRWCRLPNLEWSRLSILPGRRTRQRIHGRRFNQESSHFVAIARSQRSSGRGDRLSTLPTVGVHQASIDLPSVAITRAH
jgi:hypothetical protein